MFDKKSLADIEDFGHTYTSLYATSDCPCIFMPKGVTDYYFCLQFMENYKTMIQLRTLSQC